MSWQKCDSADPYSLATPTALMCVLGALHIWLSLSAIVLMLPSDIVVLLWFFIVRSWRNVRLNAQAVDSLVLSMDGRNRFQIDEAVRSKEPEKARIQAGRGLIEPDACGDSDDTRILSSGDGLDDAVDRQAYELRYTCCRSVKMPGCVYLDLLNDYGKRLEILVFYRYHQREFYRRLLRYLALK